MNTGSNVPNISGRAISNQAIAQLEAVIREHGADSDEAHATREAIGIDAHETHHRVEARAAALARRIVAYVTEHPGATGPEMREEFGLEKSALNDMLRKMTGQGRIRRERGQLRGRVFRYYVGDANG